MTLPKPPKVPCGSCPYRRNVPSGIWDASEYAKLPLYDGSTMEQLMAGGTALFMCHQRDGCLCGGWVMTHDRDHLVALRMHRVDPSVWDYNPDVEVWGSGAEAAAHGMRDIDEPGETALKMMEGLKRGRE